jgi:hypothetical protein
MIKEKWYLYRHPKTGDEVRLIVTPKNAKNAQMKKLNLHLKGYKLLEVVKPGGVSKCK